MAVFNGGLTGELNLCWFLVPSGIFTVADPNPQPPNTPLMCQNFCVSCPFTIPEVTVSVYSSQGGTLLASGTIDTSANDSCVWLSWYDSPGPYYVTASAAGYATIGQTFQLKCGGTTKLPFAPLCLQTTVNISSTSGPGGFFGIFGPVNLTYSDGIYSGTFVDNGVTFTIALNCSTGRFSITGGKDAMGQLGILMDTQDCCPPDICNYATCPIEIAFNQSPFNLVLESSTLAFGVLSDGTYNITATTVVC